MDWHGERRYAVYENFQLNNEQVRNGESGDLLVLSLRVGHLHLHSVGQLSATGCGEIPCALTSGLTVKTAFHEGGDAG